MKDFSEKEGVEINKTFIEKIIQHVKGFGRAFSQYFPKKQQVKYQTEVQIKNPFIVIA